MKKILLLIACVAIFAGCENNADKNKADKEQQEAQKILAERSSGKISELPLGFNFGMTELDVNEHCEELLNKKAIAFNGRDYSYKYKTSSGLEIACTLSFWFHEDELYQLKININDDKSSVVNEIDADLNKTLDSTYFKTSFYFEDTPDSRIIKWFKKNQIVFLRKAIGADLNYINAPIAKIVFDKEISKRMEDARERVDVKNSSWDGSVAQVKKYLKKNLKDLDSYEGIEWSEIQKTGNGYTVRHKYRAKNSFGGYIIENNIFYLDKKGTVVSVSAYK